MDTVVQPHPDPAARMDAMYRYTRHVYDASRRCYLIGRDRLLREMAIRPDDRVLEVGCGTARNLIRLAMKYPDIELFGLDASAEMLDTASRQVRKRGLSPRLHLRQGLAEELNPRDFERAAPFDVVFFSYSLSMIPTWHDALSAALANLAPGRSLYVVDFWDQADWPGWFRAGLRGWLDLFHVRHEPELLEHLRALSGADGLRVKSVARRYAYMAQLVRPA